MVVSIKKSSEEMEVQARMEGELNAAAKVQQSFSPQSLPQLEQFEIASMFRPAREISGDYYDIIRIDERYIALIVADVSGKGVSAAMYANIARVLLRDKTRFHNDPVEVLCNLNESLKKEFLTSHFLTLAYVLLDLKESTVSYASAGHEPIVLLSPAQETYQLLKPKGYPFSELHADMFDMRIQQESYQMQSGDFIFIYTDGLTDVENEASEMYGEDRLYEQLHKIIQESPKEFGAQQLQDEISQQLITHQGTADQTDDITMIVLKRV